MGERGLDCFAFPREATCGVAAGYTEVAVIVDISSCTITLSSIAVAFRRVKGCL